MALLVVLVPFLAQSLAACDDWPLYQSLEPERPRAPVQIVLNLLEDTTLGENEVQEIAPLPAYPAMVQIRGAIDSCGFDAQSDEYEWPEHQSEDGDGNVLQAHGWYMGGVDFFSFSLNQRGWVSIQLEWDNLPLSAANAPFLPDDEDGAWRAETDLDFVVFETSSLAAGIILNDDGFSLSYPESVDHHLAMDPAMPLIVAVGCHHQLPSGYTLSLDFSSP